MILVFGFVIAAFVGGTLFMSLAFQGSRNMPQHATVLPQAGALPRFSLVDHNGSLASLTARTYARRRCSNWRLRAAGFWVPAQALFQISY
jgi:hypothetical protein